MSSTDGHLRLDAALEGRLVAVARRLGEKPEQLLSRTLDALEVFLGLPTEGTTASQPSVVQSWLDAGLIGCAKNQPADLSTNRDHRNGFGRG